MIDSIKTLVRHLAELYPVSFTPAQLPAWEERYEAVLGSLTAVQLDAAYNATFKDWKKRAAPLPADILAAHESRARYSMADGRGAEPVKSFKDRLWEKDRKRMDDKAKIIAEYREPRRRLFAQAEVEGWLWQLERQVAIAANIIAQRNENRRPGISHSIGPSSIGPLSPDASAYYRITTFMDADQIDIPDSVIEEWREDARTPGPVTGKRPMPADRALVAAGQQSMEVNYGPDPLV